MAIAPQIYISTGEISGEQHAAALLTALQRLIPSLRCTAMGDEILRAAGAEIICNNRGLRLMGFAEVVRQALAFYRAFHAAVAHIASAQPAAVVLVDYAGFHLRLARAIRRTSASTRVIYYIAPKAWAWQESRVLALRQLHRLLCILPFEEQWFGERGVPAVYVGNPSWEAWQRAPSRAEARASLGIADEARAVSLFPGSRKDEIKRMLPLLIEAAELLAQRFGRAGEGTAAARGLRFVMALAPGITAEDLSRIAPLPGWLRLCDSSHMALAGSDLALAKSGTIALEAALALVPTVVVYRAHPLSAFIARHVVRTPFFSLPNIIAGQPVLPELFQAEANPTNIAQKAGALLADNARYESARRALLALRQTLGDKVASATAAAAVQEEIAAALAGR